MADEFVSKYEQYENLWALLFTYRRCTPGGAKLSDAEFQKQINSGDKVLISGSTGADHHHPGERVVAVLLSSQSMAMKKTAFFEALLKSVDRGADGAQRLNILIMGDEAPYPHVQKKIDEFNTTLPGTLIEAYCASLIYIIIPLHRAVPYHRVATAQEIYDIEERTYVPAREFPIILRTDPMAVWLGARPGDIVRVEIADTCGIRLKYQRVV